MKSLVLSSLDLGRVLADSGGTTFRAKGTCMYPTIRSGDILTIKSCSVDDIEIGDIAVCRCSDFLFAHRVIDKGKYDGQPYIVTRSDRRKSGSDSPTFDDNLLGVVNALRRDGTNPQVRRNELQKKNPPSPLLNIQVTILDAVARIRHRFQFNTTFPDSAVYKAFANLWFAVFRPSITYSVRVPLNATLGDTVYRNIDADHFDPERSLNGRKITRWILAMHLDGSREPVAFLIFVRDHSSSWQIADSSTRFRYRGTNLAEAILVKAKTLVTLANP